MRKIIIAILLFPFISIAQKKNITLEDIYKNGTFRAETVAATFDSADVTDKINPADIKKADGTRVTEIDKATPSPTNLNLFIIEAGREKIYRHSSKAYTYIYDLNTKKTIQLDTGKVMHPGFSPDGTKLAFVKENNLYIRDLNTNTTKAITTDGKWNHIINGNCDWVYEEEFGFTKAYEWSAMGNYIAYYRFDETNVKEYEFTIFDDSYNKQYSYKYPKAGEENSKVEIHIYNVANGEDVKAHYEQGDIYIPRIKWTKDDTQLCVFWMNRHQDNLKLLLTDANTGTSKPIYEEKNKYFVEINDNWHFLKDGKNFLFTSEMNGYRHLYLYSMDGKNKTQVTKGNYEITDINGVDEKNQLIYYTMAYPRPMDRNVFVTDFTGKKTYALTQGEKWHSATFNKDFTKAFIYTSDINTPQSVSLHEIKVNKKKEVSAVAVRTLGENKSLRSVLNQYAISKTEFIRIPNSKGDTLNGWMLKPVNFDPSKKYPVLFYNYGGPGSQYVANRYGATSMWHQMMAQKGFIIVSVDNTGTGYRGEEFKKKTYLQLGKYEIEDQIDAAKYIGNFPYVDKNHIGHWGWSYGGFMSSLAITKGADVFSAAVAVAPVTSWRFYDNIYTERYMRTPQENPRGYDDNSPLHFTDKIKGKYLLIHGTGDDNVHFQNATQMISALVKSNVDFESAYYPNKNHSISGTLDNTSFHLWSKMTNWILDNMGNANTQKSHAATKDPKAF